MIVVERVGFMRTFQFTELVAKEILLDCSHRTRKIYKGIKSRNPKSGGHWQETVFGEMSAQVTLDKLSLYTTGPFGSIAAKKYARSNNFRVAQFGGVTG